MGSSELLLLHAVLTLSLILCHVQAIQSPVNTTSGDVTGQSVTVRGKTLWEFKMVPYAEPPVGDLRFKPPRPKTRETEPIDGTREDFKVCPQPAASIALIKHLFPSFANHTETVDEDCLYLDVYVPQSASTAINLLPVMFWIHGGGYTSGYGRLASGRVLAADFDVVVVTINYRLGALGFLNTADNNAVGDFGLRDQIQALKWVNNNIRSFGGDPSKVTIAGESAGGSSVAQLTVSPLSEGLFQRAIIQSGGLDNPWACVKEPKAMTMGLANALNCSTTTTTAAVDCLRTKTSDLIVMAQSAGFFLFAPACSGGVLPFTQQELDTSQVNSDIAKRLAKLDILMGNNDQEGGMYFESFSVNQTDPQGGISAAYAANFTTQFLTLGIPPAQIPSLVPAIRFLYTDWMMPEDALARTKKAVDFAGDYFFVASALKYCHLHAKIEVPQVDRGQIYFYLLKHRPSWMPQKAWRYGADHGDDLFFVFGNPLEYLSFNATQEEITLSKTMMTYWTNFIKTGNPNSPMTKVNSNPLTTWAQFDLDNQKYLQLDTTMDSNSVDHRLFADRMAFWIDYVPAELKRLQALKPPPPCIEDESSGGFKKQATILTILISTVLVTMQMRTLL